jgi:hypothetical protein
MFVIAIWQAGKIVVEYRGADGEVELLKPIGVSVVTFLIIKSVFSEQSNHPIMFMLLGMVVALTHRLTSEAVPTSKSANTTEELSSQRRSAALSHQVVD